MVRVAVDAMGGDNAPAEVVKGCLEALKKSPETQVLAVGKEELIREALKGQTWDEERFTIVNATQVIETGDAPVASIREKKDSSIVVGLKLVREGKIERICTIRNARYRRFSKSDAEYNTPCVPPYIL